jgi:acetyl-CoA carboxylase biotin carboxyl carrier protein
MDLSLKLIENLVELVSKSEVDEVSIKEEGYKLKIKKNARKVVEAPQTVHVPQQQAAPQAQAPAQPAPSSEEKSTDDSAPSANQKTITSPIVGTFYEAPGPDQDPFIKVGDHVSKGDTVCIVEAMKIMNEIDSELEGKIVKILVDDAQPVEFEQPLFIIETK